MSINKLAVAVCAAAFVATGCGSSKASSNAGSTTAAHTATTTAQAPASPASRQVEISVVSGKPLSRAALIARGDAVCSVANAKLSTSTARTQEDFARMLPQSSSYERTEAVELSKLVPPSSMAADWQHIITDLQKFSELSARAGEYAAVKDFPAALPIAISGNKTQRDMVAIAKQDGFKVCSIP
jgi:hypothetical protein